MIGALTVFAAGLLLVLAWILGRFVIDCIGVIVGELRGPRPAPAVAVPDDPTAPAITYADVASTLPRDVVAAIEYPLVSAHMEDYR